MPVAAVVFSSALLLAILVILGAWLFTRASRVDSWSLMARVNRWPFQALARLSSDVPAIGLFSMLEVYPTAHPADVVWARVPALPVDVARDRDLARGYAPPRLDARAAAAAREDTFVIFDWRWPDALARPLPAQRREGVLALFTGLGFPSFEVRAAGADIIPGRLVPRAMPSVPSSRIARDLGREGAVFAPAFEVLTEDEDAVMTLLDAGLLRAASEAGPLFRNLWFSSGWVFTSFADLGPRAAQVDSAIAYTSLVASLIRFDERSIDFGSVLDPDTAVAQLFKFPAPAA